MNHQECMIGFYKLRLAIMNDLRTETDEVNRMELSETLRKVDADILFWEAQTDNSISGLMKTISASLERDVDNE